MTLRQAVSVITISDLDAAFGYYVDSLKMVEVMNLGWIVTLAADSAETVDHLTDGAGACSGSFSRAQRGMSSMYSPTGGSSDV